MNYSKLNIRFHAAFFAGICVCAFFSSLDVVPLRRDRFQIFLRDELKFTKQNETKNISDIIMCVINLRIVAAVFFSRLTPAGCTNEIPNHNLSQSRIRADYYFM